MLGIRRNKMPCSLCLHGNIKKNVYIYLPYVALDTVCHTMKNPLFLLFQYVKLAHDHPSLKKSLKLLKLFQCLCVFATMSNRKFRNIYLRNIFFYLFRSQQ